MLVKNLGFRRTSDGPPQKGGAAAALFAGSNYYEMTAGIGTTEFGFWNSTVWKYIGDRGLRNGARYIDENNLDADRSRTSRPGRAHFGGNPKLTHRHMCFDAPAVAGIADS